MRINLTKKQLISLVEGIEPSFSAAENPQISSRGNFGGGFRDNWAWNAGAFDNLTEIEIYDIYLLCTK